MWQSNVTWFVVELNSPSVAELQPKKKQFPIFCDFCTVDLDI